MTFRRQRMAALIAGALWPMAFGCLATRPSPTETRGDAAPRQSVARAAEVAPAAAEPDGARPLRVPTGDVPRLSCVQARRVMAQVRERLPAPPPAVSPDEFADLWADWFDPHGLWSVAPDSPLPAAVQARASRLLAEIELPASASTPCAAALELGAVVKPWIDELASIFEASRTAARPRSMPSALALAADPLFDDDTARPARELAADLGGRIGSVLPSLPAVAEIAGGAALARFFPDLPPRAWSECVLAAAVRAYVPAVDPHSEWAPLDEEWSLFEGDPLDTVEPRLWASALRTPVGARLTEEPTAPLEEDDVVLSVEGLPTAGLSAEQIAQLSRAEPEQARAARRVLVLRGLSPTPRELLVPLPADPEPETISLEARRERYGNGSVLVVPLPEVGDHAGDDVASLIADAKLEETPLGVLLDLRGNGGGSTDGAAGVIGVFLPGAPSFPLIHRGVVREVMRAGAPDPRARWSGPVAVLVDGYTASAAEMIAGAIDRYGRGPLLGARTFGKGCVQEYFDDCSGQGVLRLTTLLVALPDGTPLQRTGLEPEWPLHLPGVGEQEADLHGAPPVAAGPDVRQPSAMGGSIWPRHHGRVGPCEDPVVCRALSALGSGAGARIQKEQRNPRISQARRPSRARPVLGRNEHSSHDLTQSRGGPRALPR